MVEDRSSRGFSRLKHLVHSNFKTIPRHRLVNIITIIVRVAERDPQIFATLLAADTALRVTLYSSERRSLWSASSV
jgi:predicted Zn-dependent protease with MMP-like domain